MIYTSGVRYTDQISGLSTIRYVLTVRCAFGIRVSIRHIYILLLMYIM